MIGHYHNLIVSHSYFLREGCDKYGRLQGGKYVVQRLVITIVARVLHIYCKQRLVDPITVCGPEVHILNILRYIQPLIQHMYKLH